MKKQKKCYIYTRVFTAIQVDGYSLDAQKDKLRKYAEYPIYDGCHEAIISEADWQLAHEKRTANGFLREKVHDMVHAHILSGLLKCPCCGKSLYGNIAKAHSKDKYTRYYYYCKNTLGQTGHKCTFRLNIEQTEMNRIVAAIISAMVKDDRFKSAIKKKIGTAAGSGISYSIFLCRAVERMGSDKISRYIKLYGEFYECMKEEFREEGIIDA